MIADQATGEATDKRAILSDELHHLHHALKYYDGLRSFGHVTSCMTYEAERIREKIRVIEAELET
jgi:hypothetical protein